MRESCTNFLGDQIHWCFLREWTNFEPKKQTKMRQVCGKHFIQQKDWNCYTYDVLCNCIHLVIFSQTSINCSVYTQRYIVHVQLAPYCVIADETRFFPGCFWLFPNSMDSFFDMTWSRLSHIENNYIISRSKVLCLQDATRLEPGHFNHVKITCS